MVVSVVSVSGVFLLGITVLLLFREGGLKVRHAVVCGPSGFCPAPTSIAPGIRQSAASVAALVGAIGM